MNFSLHHTETTIMTQPRTEAKAKTEATFSQVPFLRDFTSETKRTVCGLTVDIGRQRMTADDLDGLFELARDKGVLEASAAMRRGEIVNPSEGRAALHTALRDPRVNAPYHAEVQRALERICLFADMVRSGRYCGCRGDKITDVINVGIGGSEMGPRTVYHALRGVQPPVRLHFLSAADGVSFDRIVGQLNPFKTLIIVSSKSFRTRETAVNAAALDQWLLEAGISGADRARHMLVVSANPEAAGEMNLPQENFFPIWEWVGGRFSVWSAIGLCDAIALGSDAFLALLAGAHAMDMHVESSGLRENVPLLMALVSYWNSVKLGIALHCCLPYDERLRNMVLWQQQLEMESLGKSVGLDGEEVPDRTGQGIWGGHGNESQHSFYQWLREGTANSSIDLLWCERPGHRHADLHRVLIANAKAQAEALVTREGSRWFNAVTTISIDELDAARLGALMALYEHKTTMLGTLYGINPFDQPGVEFGKKLSRKAESSVEFRAAQGAVS
ncbi:MAG: glucose-6-phosphate isomerase [Duodenibacillus sp.]|nr:glucose-6-phosphate isomerase [Duodenibacillus sp.]